MRDDHDGPQAADLERYGDAGVTCRGCGREVYDELEECPHCGAPVCGGGGGTPKWAVVTAAVLIVLLVLGALTAVLGRM
ncbi:MAG: hypothetical protein KF866_09080 [Phycisphaeraceae bacterium]|nr:hypothetical protein [Phycisphaeraceae bacterium]MCW5754030.1 hypothetical protein [Phycisphaeraceae bacterium]